MKKALFALTVCMLTLFFSTAQSTDPAKQFNLENQIAIKGYDPVAYFQENMAVKGKSQISFSEKGVTYYFANDVNKALFIKDPKKYKPQYGGWCAYAMGDTKEKVDIDPETFKILDGKLYLFYHTFLTNTLNKWNKDEAKLKEQGDENWYSILNPPIKSKEMKHEN